MIYRVSGIINVIVDATDVREAITQARKRNPTVIWITAEERREEEYAQKEILDGGETTSTQTDV